MRGCAWSAVVFGWVVQDILMRGSMCTSLIIGFYCNTVECQAALKLFWRLMLASLPRNHELSL